MPKNVKKRRKHPKYHTSIIEEDHKNYIYLGQITKAFGNRNFEITLLDGTTRLGHLQNGLRKPWISINTYVLVQPESEDVHGKQEIVRIFSLNEAVALKKEGRLRVIEDTETKDKPEPEVIFLGREAEVTNTGFSDDEVDLDAI